MPSERRQRQREARRAKRESERKAAARRELIRRIAIALGLGLAVATLLLVSAGLSGGDDEVELPPDLQAFRDQPTACGGDLPDPPEEMRFDQPVDQGLTGPVTAVVETSCGSFEIALDVDGAPETVNSFVFLARQGFYDGTPVHRIVQDSLIQAGDPTGSGRGGPGYRLPDEFPSADFVYEEGVVAMANAGRGTTGSQFFVVVGPNASGLPPSFSVIGTVTSGTATLDAIEAVPTLARPGSVEESLPTESVYVESVEIRTGG